MFQWAECQSIKIRAYIIPFVALQCNRYAWTCVNVQSNWMPSHDIYTQNTCECQLDLCWNWFTFREYTCILWVARHMVLERIWRWFTLCWIRRLCQTNIDSRKSSYIFHTCEFYYWNYIQVVSVILFHACLLYCQTDDVDDVVWRMVCGKGLGFPLYVSYVFEYYVESLFYIFIIQCHSQEFYYNVLVCLAIWSVAVWLRVAAVPRRRYFIKELIPRTQRFL